MLDGDGNSDSRVTASDCRHFIFFSDLSVSYRTTAYEIGLACNNIFGNTQYERKNITVNQEIYTINKLRPRELLCKVSFNL